MVVGPGAAGWWGHRILRRRRANHRGERATFRGAGRSPSSRWEGDVSENKATVERYMHGFNISDHDLILSCLTDDIVWDMPGAYHLVGKEAFEKEIENEAFVGRPTPDGRGGRRRGRRGDGPRHEEGGRVPERGHLRRVPHARGQDPAAHVVAGRGQVGSVSGGDPWHQNGGWAPSEIESGLRQDFPTSPSAFPTFEWPQALGRPVEGSAPLSSTGSVADPPLRQMEGRHFPRWLRDLALLCEHLEGGENEDAEGQLN